VAADTRTRAQKNRHIRRESLREELKSREYLRQVHRILNKDLAERDLPQNEIMRLKARMQGYFNLLSKTLPDVKAIELDAIFSTPDQSRDELETRLRGLGINPEALLGADPAQTQH